MNTAGRSGISATKHAGWVYTGRIVGEGVGEELICSALLRALDAANAAGMGAENIVRCDVMANSEKLFEGVVTAYKRKVSSRLPTFRFQSVTNNSDCVPLSLELTGVTADSGVSFDRFYLEQQTSVPVSIRAGDYIYTSQMLPDGDGTLTEQTLNAIGKAVKAVEAAGGCAENIIKNFVLLDDCGNFDQFNIPYAQVFGVNPQPAARSLIGVSSVEGRLCAIDSVAYLGNRRTCVSVGALAGKMPFCSAMIAGDFMFGSGQIGIIGGDGGYVLSPEGQSERLMEVVSAVLAAGGLKSTALLKTVGFALNGEFLKAMNKAATAYLTGEHAQTAQLVHQLANPAILVEMEFVAKVMEDKT